MEQIRKEKIIRYFIVFVRFAMTLMIIESGIIMCAEHNSVRLGAGFIIVGFMIFVSLLYEYEEERDSMTIYIDMDGCIAVWSDATEEQLLTSAYYEQLYPERVLMEVAMLLLRKGYNVVFLTAVMNDAAREGKKRWLKKWDLDMFPVIFVPYGEDKGKYVKKISGTKVLLDDYSKNLRSWEARGNEYVSVKFRNRINGTHGTWDGKPCVYYFQTAENICRMLIDAGLNSRYSKAA